MGGGGWSDLGGLRSPKQTACCLYEEPFWTNVELEIFWFVLREHLGRLLSGKALCPEPDIDFDGLDSSLVTDYDRCLHRVQELTWHGRYSQAVANFLAVKNYFRHCQPKKYADCVRDNDIETLRLLFMRRMPPCFKT